MHPINLSLSDTLEDCVTLLPRRFARLTFWGRQGGEVTSFSIRSWIFSRDLYVQSPGDINLKAVRQTEPVLLFAPPYKNKENPKKGSSITNWLNSYSKSDAKHFVTEDQTFY